MRDLYKFTYLKVGGKDWDGKQGKWTWQYKSHLPVGCNKYSIKRTVLVFQGTGVPPTQSDGKGTLTWMGIAAIRRCRVAAAATPGWGAAATAVAAAAVLAQPCARPPRGLGHLCFHSVTFPGSLSQTHHNVFFYFSQDWCFWCFKINFYLVRIRIQ